MVGTEMLQLFWNSFNNRFSVTLFACPVWRVVEFALMFSVECASGAGSGCPGPWISSQLDSTYASSGLWRFGQIILLGGVTFQGNDQGRRHGMCSRALEPPPLVGPVVRPTSSQIIYIIGRNPLCVDAVVAGWCVGNVAFWLF